MADGIEKSKKRKKHGDGNLRPSKRVAIDIDNITDRPIAVVYHEADKWAPVVASAPGVVLPTSIPLKPYTKRRSNGLPKDSGSIARTELLLHSSEHPRLDYTAREEELGGADALLKHYIGVFDPATGKLEVMEARKMVVRGSVRAHQAEVEEEPEVNLKDLRNTLGQAFGTKKAKKAIASLQENAITPAMSARSQGGRIAQSTTTAAVLDSMKDITATMATRAELQAAVSAAAPRPKANTAAEDVKEVYTVDSLIGVDVLKQVAVLHWQEAAKANKPVEVKSRFVASRIMREAKDVEKLRILRYMLLLLEIQKASKSSRGGLMLPKKPDLKAMTSDISSAVVESVKRKFSDGGIMNKLKQDLLITHLCALACLVDNFSVDIFDLQEDLRLDTKQMSQYFREIGAKVAQYTDAELKRMQMTKAQASQRRFAKLKLPLEFPKVGAGRKR